VGPGLWRQEPFM